MARPGRTVALVVLGLAAVAAPAAAQRARAPVQEVTGGQRPGAPGQLGGQPEGANFELVALSERWHDVPQGQRLKLSVQIIDEVTELGNLIGTGMNELSDNAIGLKFDGRKRRAKLRFGTGEGQYLRFRLESDWHFTHGKARIAAKLQLGIGDHQWNIELPDMEMSPASYRGERGVEVRIPLFERKW